MDALLCTWPEPSRNGDVLCRTAGTTWWFDAWGRRVVRCRKHFRETAADAARALGWEVHRIEEGATR
jgi:hypothetical protein